MNAFHRLKSFYAVPACVAGFVLLIDALLIYFVHQSNHVARGFTRNFADIIIITATILYSSHIISLVKEPLDINDCELFREFPVPMYVFIAETYKLVAVNAAALRQYGYKQADFVRLKASDLVLEGKVKRCINCMEGGDEFCCDMGQWLHRDKDGERFYVQVFERQTTYAGKSAKLVFAITIEQLISAELRFKKEHDEPADILDYISDPFYAVDTHWQFTFVNKEFERLQHRNRLDLLGKNVWELFPYGKELSFYQQYERAVRERVSVHFEEYNPYNGMWVFAHAYPTNTGLAIYFKDITVEKQHA